jgi:3-methyl-2-oxobutanoate hydroxymethyltransferase
MDAMVHHCAAAASGINAAAAAGAGRAPLLVGDMPFGSYLTPEDAARNAVRLLKEGRAGAVKLEGGVRVLPQVRALVDAGIAVVGHVGLTPQTAAATGGFGVRGRSVASAMQVLEDAVALEQAGACAVVLEMVPAQLATAITARLRVPTIGIGAGGGTSGQVQVMPDILGSLTPDPRVLKHARLFARPAAVGDIALDALQR